MALFSVVLITGIPATPARARLRTIRVVLVIPGVLATLLTVRSGHPALFLVSRALILTVLAVASGVVVIRLVQQSRVAADTFSGAAGGYMFRGVMFALAFSITESLAPGRVHLATPADASRRGVETFSELQYFSVVTLTTLAYGDTAPVAAVAQTLAVGRRSGPVLSGGASCQAGRAADHRQPREVHRLTAPAVVPRPATGPSRRLTPRWRRLKFAAP